jgi:hypothetical protein
VDDFQLWNVIFFQPPVQFCRKNHAR